MGKVMRAVLAPCPLLLSGCHRWRGAGRASGDKLCLELSRIWPEFGQQCLDADSSAAAGTICYFLSLSQSETLPGAGGDPSASGTFLLLVGLFLECLGRSSDGMSGPAGAGAASTLHPHIEELFCTSCCGPHLKNSKERAGSTGKCVLSHLWKWDLAALWGDGPWMPEQDPCPDSAWGPSLPYVFPPCVLLSLSRVISCLLVALCLPPL